MGTAGNPTPRELLDDNVVLTIGQVALVLFGHYHKDRARRLVLELIDDGRLRLVDPNQANTRWTVAADEVRRYIGGAS